MRKLIIPIKNGLFDNNPTFVQLLGMCPTLAVTTSVSNAIGMGLAATAVLICSNILISLLRKFIPKEVRIAAYIVVIAGFVTAIELLMKAYVPALYSSLGLYSSYCRELYHFGACGSIRLTQSSASLRARRRRNGTGLHHGALSDRRLP